MGSVILNVHLPAVRDKDGNWWKVWLHQQVWVGVAGAAKGEGEREVNGDSGWYHWHQWRHELP